ncbi:MAG TPA: hypothetical protein VGM84_20055 [Steroidobacteraceae bacterium]
MARRVVWFEEPEKALANPVRFLAYAMTYALHEDVRVIRRYLSDDDFREALDNAPPGIIDPRSWAYWNLKMGRFPAPPMPKRTFGGAEFGSRAPTEMSSDESARDAAQEWRRIRGLGPAKR